MFHSLALVVVTVLATLLSSSALYSVIEGFTYIGPVPTSPNQAEPSTKAFSYYISNVTATWDIASFRCSELEGKLATLTNPEEDAALHSYRMLDSLFADAIWTGGKKDNAIWIGGRKNTSWAWEKNVTMTIRKFQSLACEETGECLYASHPKGGKWGWCGGDCDISHYYVCQFSIDFKKHSI